MNWDENLFYVINGLAGQWSILDWLMYELSQEGNLLYPIVLLTGYWAWTNWQEARIAAPALALLIGMSDLIGGQLKQLIGRPRPCHVLTQIYEIVGCGGSMSLPSNHALNSSTAAAFLFVLYPRTGWVTVPLVVLIGISRVFLGAHYVTDVLGGWMLGSALGVGMAWWVTKLPPFGRVKKPIPETS